jgi:hypothetical protein
MDKGSTSNNIGIFLALGHKPIAKKQLLLAPLQ